jgi:predicted dehydrogenase
MQSQATPDCRKKKGLSMHAAQPLKLLERSSIRRDGRVTQWLVAICTTRYGGDRLRVAGEKGVVEIAEAEATICTNNAPLRKLPPDEPASIFEEFIRHIETGAPMRMSAEEALALRELSLRAREAADTGASIRVGTREGKS